MLALSTPSLLFRYGAKIFGSYLRGGEVASEHLERTAELRFSNMSDAPDLMFVEWQGGISSLHWSTRALARSWCTLRYASARI